jgi:hypothetical protein
MKRSLVVILAGLLTTLLLVSLGTKAVLALSANWGVVGQSKGFESTLDAMTQSLRALVAFVHVPTALLVGFLVGRFSQKRQISSAIIATCPAWILLLAAPPWGTLAGVLIAGAGVLGAWLSKRVPHIRTGVGAAASN